jgi:hypothetical protein
VEYLSALITALRFPSADWCAAYKDAINANGNYKTAGRDWTHGSVAMVVTADPAIGIAEDTAMWLDLHQGTCRDCRLVSREEAEKASFVIVAGYGPHADDREVCDRLEGARRVHVARPDPVHRRVRAIGGDADHAE